MTTDEVAKVLRIGAFTVRRLIRDGKFPGATRPGKSWLIPESDLAAYAQKIYGRRSE